MSSPDFVEWAVFGNPKRIGLSDIKMRLNLLG